MKNTVKNATRHLVAKAYDIFAKGKNAISVVSLPGNTWELENYVFQNYNYANVFETGYQLDMTLLEKEPDLFNFHYHNKNNSIPVINISSYLLQQENVSYKNEYLNESHVNNCKSNNIFAWFDFCGNPATDNLKLIDTAKGKNVTFIFTFNTAWRSDKNVDFILKNVAKHHNKTLATHTYLNLMAERLGLHLIWSFEYVSNHTPMISVCVSNDANVIAEKSLNVFRVKTRSDSDMIRKNRTRSIKRDLSAVYADIKLGLDRQLILNTHNISIGTYAAVKAWITMGK